LSPIECDVEAPGYGQDYLLKFKMCMSPTRCAAGDIVKVIDPPDGKWNLSLTFCDCEIPSLIPVAGEFNEPSTPRWL